MTFEPESLREEAQVPLQRGTNQAGMRAQNERLVLSLVRRHGSLAKSEIARMTGLSAQTVSVIMRALESDRLLRRGEPQRGRVGQPMVPLSLDPDGAFFLGAKVGRRSLDFVLVDFAGGIRHRNSVAYPFPTPRDTVRLILEEIARCQALLGEHAPRIAGLGLAMPFALWSWAEEIGAPTADLEAWRGTDIQADLAARLPWPVYVQNDATAACGAELVFGERSGLQDFIYFYVGAFVGGGLVLNGGLFAGRTGNAAALGSMPVPDGAGGSAQLIDVASLVLLERRLRARGLPLESIYAPTADWSGYGTDLDDWLATAARGIAHAVAAGSAIIDFEAAVIDGAFPAAVRTDLIARVATELGRLDLSGIEPQLLMPGSIGPIARALGGASLPLFDRYLVDQRAVAGGLRRPGETG
jgi:predicted NBD/HSP70 family sugar kinase